MSNEKDTNRQTSANSIRKGFTNAIARRRVIIGGTTTLAAGLITAGIAKPELANSQQPRENNSNQKLAAGRLKSKVAIITGAARGIGRACAVTLAREGADIIALDIARQIDTIVYPLSTSKDLSETERLVKAQGRRCLAVEADIRDMESMKQLVERSVKEFGKVDILVANAGIIHKSSLEQMTDEQWRDVIDVNLTGTANSLRAVIPHMVNRKSGRIVAISSDLGRRGGPERAHYVASKWGIIRLMKSAALELAKTGITVNAISPGFTRSGMSQNLAQYRDFRPDLTKPTEADVAPIVTKMNAENNEIPIPWLEPEDIANGVLYLVSDEGRYVTGAALDITAGKNSHYTA
jgi:SDR family mycofactocin-dependent oxidoreductase